MLKQKRNDKPLLLNLPTCVLEEVDLSVREQGVTRSHFLRRAIERNLRLIKESNGPSSLASINRACRRRRVSFHM
jgi:metal-responsive CopG/Arc/MetJ family transcriptional regulator